MSQQIHTQPVVTPRRSTAARARAARRVMTTREARAAYVFMLPSLIILSVFVFWPIVQSILYSFQDWQFGQTTTHWTGLANYQAMMSDYRVTNAFHNTVLYAAVTVPAGIVLSLLLALAVNEKLPAIPLFRSAFFLPVLTSFAIMSLVWRYLLNPDIGLLSYWMLKAGFPTNDWLNDPTWAIWGVIAVSIWKNVGFNMVIFLAGLQGISEHLYEAAKVDGANAWRRFINVTLPQLRPTMLFVLVVSVIAAFEVFDVVWVLTPGGGPLFSTDVIVTYIYYHEGIELLDISYASTIAVALFVGVFVLTLIQLRLLRFTEAD
jgi:multiple sugar transport system permease protein